MRSEAETLRIKKASIENIKLIQQPQSSIHPIKPKKKLNVMLAFITGLMFAVFLAFFLEYLQKMGIYAKSSTTLGQKDSVKKTNPVRVGLKAIVCHRSFRPWPFAISPIIAECLPLNIHRPFVSLN